MIAKPSRAPFAGLRLRSPSGCGNTGPADWQVRGKMGEAPMDEKLVAACQMFLVPATILFAALAVATTEALKTLLCIIGVVVSTAWLYRLYRWTGLSDADRNTAFNAHVGLAANLRTSGGNSLLTRNFAFLGPQKPISLHETTVLQRLFTKFPTQINRENILKNREILSGNREFHLARDKRPFLTHLLSVVRTRSVLADEFSKARTQHARQISNP